MATRDDIRPAARLLAVLELLQDRPGISGPAIAERLGVSTRTVRRYVATLQDMGIPVAPSPGRLGGYRLLPGFRLPPLMFSAEEAVGLAVALLATRATAYDDLPPAVSSAFGKIQRVLPTSLARQLEALHQVTRLPDQTSTGRRRFPDPAVLASLARAALTGRRCSIRYHRAPGSESRRELDPYGLATVYGRWYVHGYCSLRRAPRTFRVDRISRVDAGVARFTPPEGLDVMVEVERSLALGRQWHVELVVDAAAEDVRAVLPPQFAELRAVDPSTTQVLSSTSNLDWFAWRIGDLPFDVRVVSPPELRASLRTAAASLLRIADA